MTIFDAGALLGRAGMHADLSPRIRFFVSMRAPRSGDLGCALYDGCYFACLIFGKLPFHITQCVPITVWPACVNSFISSFAIRDKNRSVFPYLGLYRLEV